MSAISIECPVAAACDITGTTNMNRQNSMKYQFVPQGTCSRLIDIEIENGVIKEVRFTGGCHGNLQGIGALVKGMKPADVVVRLSGIRCGNKETSCPDQLSQALRKCTSC